MDEKSKMSDEKYMIYDGFCERPIYCMKKEDPSTRFSNKDIVNRG